MIAIPQSVKIVEHHVANGDRADSTHPLVADCYQTYLIAGKPWPEPLCLGPHVQIPTDDGGMVTRILRVPVLLRPGCCGFAWRGKMVRLLLSGDNPSQQVTADVYDPADLATPLNAFQSVVESATVAALPEYDCDNDADVTAILSVIQGAPIVGPQAQWYAVPPEVPTPGLLQIVPLRSFRHVILEFSFAGIGFGWLEIQPLVYSGPIAGMSGY